MIYLLDINLRVPSSNTSTNWQTLIPIIGSIIVSLAVIIFNFFNTKKTNETNEKNIVKTLEQNSSNIDKTLDTNRKINEDNLKSKIIEQRKAEIYKMLNELYGPLSLLKKKSTLLYEKFKIGKKANYKGRYSTLLYLLENEGLQGLSKNDNALLNEIIKIGTECEKLLQDKAGLIDDEILRQDKFPKLSRHYLILRLAYAGNLHGQVELYEDSMFPSEIDGLIDKKINALHKELKEL